MDAFKAEHGELFTPKWWANTQERVFRGEILDVFPYPRERWLDLDDDASSGANPPTY